jgi:hypothetical protein
MPRSVKTTSRQRTDIDPKRQEIPPPSYDYTINKSLLTPWIRFGFVVERVPSRRWITSPNR